MKSIQYNLSFHFCFVFYFKQKPLFQKNKKTICTSNDHKLIYFNYFFILRTIAIQWQRNRFLDFTKFQHVQLHSPPTAIRF